MNVISTSLPGVIIIEPRVFSDDRGVFFESFNQPKYEEIGIKEKFVQDNISISQSGVLRGLHFQHTRMQGKLVSVLHGEVYDVAVDIRVGSPTFKQWTSVVLNHTNRRQLYIPAGFAHGFVATQDNTIFSYKCTDIYIPNMDMGIAWNDPEINVIWPINSPILSPKDQAANKLCNLSYDLLPKIN